MLLKWPILAVSVQGKSKFSRILQKSFITSTTGIKYTNNQMHEQDNKEEAGHVHLKRLKEPTYLLSLLSTFIHVEIVYFDINTLEHKLSFKSVQLFSWKLWLLHLCNYARLTTGPLPMIAIAQWNRQHLPSYGPEFESQALVCIWSFLIYIVQTI